MIQNMPECFRALQYVLRVRRQIETSHPAGLITYAAKKGVQGKSKDSQVSSLKLILNVGNVLRKFGREAKTGLSRETELPEGITCASSKLRSQFQT
jgi:hypothetical protein